MLCFGLDEGEGCARVDVRDETTASVQRVWNETFDSSSAGILCCESRFGAQRKEVLPLSDIRTGSSLRVFKHENLGRSIALLGSNDRDDHAIHSSIENLNAIDQSLLNRMHPFQRRQQFLTIAAACLVPAVFSSAARGQETPAGSVPTVEAGVTFAGKVVADGLGVPLPYSTVTLDPLDRERFTDQTGVFVYYSLPPGSYRLRVRQLGYIPIDTTIVIGRQTPGSPILSMTRIATALEGVEVSAPPRKCIIPGEDGSVDDPELSTVLGEARKNADRERLLRRTYPFEYRMAQSHATYDVVSKTQSIKYDTMTFRSDDNWRYRNGKVVTDDRSKLFGEVRVMRLPTLADLADRTFLTAHCFKYSGTSEQNGAVTHRIDFAPDSALIAPDVEGSIFIDSATYLINRAEFRLTRGGAVRPPIRGMTVVTTYRQILPNVALFDEIASVQPLDGHGPPGTRAEFREMQRLLNFRFLRGGPPGTDGHKWTDAPGARTDSTLLGSSEPAPRAGQMPPP